MMGTRGKELIMLEQKAEITQALQAILKKSGKDFLSLSIVKKKMGAGLRKSLGVRSSHSSKSVKELLEPYLGETLEILKGGRSVYLAIRRAPADWALMELSTHATKGVGALGKLLPIFSKTRLIGVLNELLKDGRVLASLNEKGEVRLSLPEALSQQTPVEAPVCPAQPAAVVPAEAQGDGDKSGEFERVFNELERQRLFVRICDLRRRLSWPREVFDEHLRRLRQEGTIQLHIADANLMSREDLDDCFIDENGFRMGMVTRHDK